MHLIHKLPHFARHLHEFSDGDVFYRPVDGNILTDDLHLVDEKSSDKTIREGRFLVPKSLKGLGVQSWLTVATVKIILGANDPKTMTDEAILALFIVRY